MLAREPGARGARGVFGVCNSACRCCLLAAVPPASPAATKCKGGGGASGGQANLICWHGSPSAAGGDGGGVRTGDGGLLARGFAGDAGGDGLRAGGGACGRRVGDSERGGSEDKGSCCCTDRLAWRMAAMNSWCLERQLSCAPVSLLCVLQSHAGGGGFAGPSRGCSGCLAPPGAACVNEPSGARGRACLSLEQMAVCCWMRLSLKPREQKGHRILPSGIRVGCRLLGSRGPSSPPIPNAAPFAANSAAAAAAALHLFM
mmetsp:Transcript_115028/g.330467  ORF Transcript_115028/g.330467 Transcript_115028/m.330467 type:complete len:259 (+) Transcript_115028:1467-2243(+)